MVRTQAQERRQMPGAGAQPRVTQVTHDAHNGRGVRVGKMGEDHRQGVLRGLCELGRPASP